MASAEVIDDPVRLSSVVDAWDALAVQLSAPYASPHWLLPWWRHVAPEWAKLYVVAVIDDAGELIGLGPWYLDARRGIGPRIRPLGADLCDWVGPLAQPGQKAIVAEQFARVFHDLRPRVSVISLEGRPSASSWGKDFEVTGRARSIHWRTEPALFIPLEGGTFNNWFMSKSKHFRQRMRKLRRDFEASGGTYRLADESSLDADLASFARLHRARWIERGRSNALRPGVNEMLLDAGRALVGSGRLRVWSLDIDGITVSSHVLVTAGRELGYWLTGFDEERAPGSSLLGILHVIEDSFASGAARLDLGSGRFAYKQRFADAETDLVWEWVVPPGPQGYLLQGYLLQTQLAPHLLRKLASERLSRETKGRILKLMAKLPRGAGPSP